MASKEIQLIKAASEAKALAERTRAYTTVLEAGLEPGRAAQAAEMIAYMTVSPDLPESKRASDPVIKELVTELRRSPSSPSKGPRPRSSDVVVTMPRRRE